MSIFHAYDVRGIYPNELDEDIAYKIGFYITELLNTDKVLVGRDMRTSSPSLFDALKNGIIDSGSDVYDAGLATTPTIYYLTAKYKFEASVMLTASHNGKEYNGFKFSAKDALPIGYNNGLSELEKLTKNKVKKSNEKGQLIDFDKKNDYLNFLKSYIPNNLESINICLDCSNGMAGLYIDEIIKSENINIFNKELDGTFPNHEANPLNPENLEQIKNQIQKNKSDIGIIFDGDADRVMFLDENSEFIPPDLIIALLGKYFIKDKTKTYKVLQDIRSSKAISEYLKKIGKIEMYTWRVGRAFAAPKLKEIDGLWGGEFAGHYYFKDMFYSDSGFLSMLIVLSILIKEKKKGKTVSELISEIKTYSNSGEINFKIEEKEKAIQKVVNNFTAKEKPDKVMDFDGYRIEFSDWWFNIRPSNTEPYLRLLVEAKNENLLKMKLNQIKRILKEFE